MDNTSETHKARLECGQCAHYTQDKIFPMCGSCELEIPDEEGMVHMFEFTTSACYDFTSIS